MALNRSGCAPIAREERGVEVESVGRYFADLSKILHGLERILIDLDMDLVEYYQTTWLTYKNFACRPSFLYACVFPRKRT